MQAIRSVNLALRFALELCAIAALTDWGYETGDSAAAGVALGIAASLTMIVIWGAFVAPKSRFSLSKPAKWILGLAILLVAAGALADAGLRSLAPVFGVVATINAALMAVWDQ